MYSYKLFLYFFFFFSSRRRHTRWNCYWSSDVCSSDLGAFTVETGLIDGAFQVGVTPGSLQWLPGAQAKVFTESRGGYVWAPMRLTGPVNKPQDDLTGRLRSEERRVGKEGRSRRWLERS